MLSARWPRFMLNRAASLRQRMLLLKPSHSPVKRAKTTRPQYSKHNWRPTAISKRPKPFPSQGHRFLRPDRELASIILLSSRRPRPPIGLLQKKPYQNTATQPRPLFLQAGLFGPSDAGSRSGYGYRFRHRP